MSVRASSSESLVPRFSVRNPEPDRKARQPWPDLDTWINAASAAEPHPARLESAWQRFFAPFFALFPARALIVDGVRGLASACRLYPGASCACRTIGGDASKMVRRTSAVGYELIDEDVVHEEQIRSAISIEVQADRVMHVDALFLADLCTDRPADPLPSLYRRRTSARVEKIGRGILSDSSVRQVVQYLEGLLSGGVARVKLRETGVDVAHAGIDTNVLHVLRSCHGQDHQPAGTSQRLRSRAPGGAGGTDDHDHTQWDSCSRTPTDPAAEVRSTRYDLRSGQASAANRCRPVSGRSGCCRGAVCR